MCDVCNCYFSNFGLFFALLPPEQPKKSKLKKKQKTPGDNILHMCTKYYDQMMYIKINYATNYITIYPNPNFQV